MPVFTIETPAGKQLDIEAPDQATALQGAQQWHEQQQPSGIVTSAQQGLSSLAGDTGKTLHDYLGPGYVGDALTQFSKATAPANFVQPNIVDDSGFHPGNIPARLAQMAPGITAQILAARLGGGIAGKLGGGAGARTAGQILGAGGVGTLESAGNEAQTAMNNQPGNTPGQAPNADALTRGAAVSGAANLGPAAALQRFLPTAASSKIIPGLAGALSAAKQFTVNAGANAVGGMTSDAAHQLGQSVGVPNAPAFSFPELADAGASSLAAGGALGAPRAAGDVLNSKAYSAASALPRSAMSAFANRMSDAADGRNLDAGFIRRADAQETGKDVFTKAQDGVHSELDAAVSNLAAPLPAAASNIVKSVKSGGMPTGADYATLKTALGADPQAANVLNLVQQAHAADIVASTGSMNEGKFSGGLGAAIASKLTKENIFKTAGIAMASAAVEGGAGHLIAYSPEMLGGMAGLSALGRLSDSMTGVASPAGRAVRGFGDGGATPVRLTPNAPPPAAPAAPGTTGNPLNAPLGGPGQPFGAAPPSVVPSVAQAPLPQAKAAALLNPLALPSSMTAPVSNIVKGWMNTQKMKAAALGTQDAASEINKSPLIDQLVGGAQNIPSPQMAKEIRTAIGSAKALKQIQSDPEAEAIQATADKAAAKSAAVPTKAPVASVAPVPTPNVTSVSKGNGKVNVGHDGPDEYAIPYSPHADKAPDVAARSFLADAKTAGVKINNENGFVTATTRNITNIRRASQDVAARTPGVSSSAISAQFEGAQTRAEAAAHRDWLAKTVPQAAGVLAHYFSDAEIAKIWKR
jgi:hypothetical protein